MIKSDVALQPGDRVVLGHDGSCRKQEKIVSYVDDEYDRVWFSDGTSYHHAEDPLLVLDVNRPKVLIPQEVSMNLQEAHEKFVAEFWHKFGIHGIGMGSGQINVYVMGHREERGSIPDVFEGWPTNIMEIESADLAVQEK